MKEDFKNFGKLMLVLFSPFLLFPFAAKCSQHETARLKTECYEQGGRVVINPRNGYVTGCVLGKVQ
jgi:hypothetical protein